MHAQITGKNIDKKDRAFPHCGKNGKCEELWHGLAARYKYCINLQPLLQTDCLYLPKVEIIDLGVRRSMAALPGLIRFLRKNRNDIFVLLCELF